MPLQKMCHTQIKSFGYAFQGIAKALKEELHMKIHCMAIVAVLCAGFYFAISPLEWVACIICFGAVLSAEILNSAIEAVVDKISPQRHPLAKKAKDMAAGAVLILAIMSVIVALIIFIPKFAQM